MSEGGNAGMEPRAWCIPDVWTSSSAQEKQFLSISHQVIFLDVTRFQCPVNNAVSSVWWNILESSKLGSPPPRVCICEWFIFPFVDTCWASWALPALSPLSRLCHDCIPPFLYLMTDPALSLCRWSRERLEAGYVQFFSWVTQERKQRCVSIILFSCLNVSSQNL